MLDFTTYTQTWSSLCSSPAGCEHPGCLHMCVRLPPSHLSCVFSEVHCNRGGLPKTEVSPEFQDRSWLWLHCYCSRYWTLLSKMHQPRLLLKFRAGHNTAVFFKWRCLLCSVPGLSLFCLLAELQGKWCQKIPCIGCVLTFQFGCMLVCGLMCSPNGNKKPCAPCYCSDWTFVEYLFLFPDYPIVFWTISTLSVLVIIASTDWKCVVWGSLIIHWI